MGRISTVLNGKLIGRILSYILLITSLSMLLSLPVSLFYRETETALMFLIIIAVLSAISIAGILFFKPIRTTLRVRDGFLVVTLSWFLMSLAGALPFWFSGSFPTFIAAFFESASGFTTTGSTILSDVESLTKGVQFWRTFTHWLGGMGILVFVVALLPSLGVGGLQLIQAEAPGPTTDKLASKLTDTAKILYTIYLVFTAVETVLLLLGGMDWFDALTHSFATMGTGGFGNYNNSIAAFDSPYIQWVITLFMMLAGTRFTLYYLLLRRKFKEVAGDSEMKVYWLIWGAVTVLLTVILLKENVVPSLEEALRLSGFQTASLLTTTGFATADFDLWPAAAKMLLFLLYFIGGCAGSTGGGIKVIRLISYFKFIKRGLYLRLHPNAVVPVKIGGKPLSQESVSSISTFLFFYMFLILLGTAVVAFDGQDLVTALSASLACLGNVGPGFNLVGPACNFGFLSGFTKTFLAFLMIVGRLELFTVLTIFMPSFWNPNKY